MKLLIFIVACIKIFQCFGQRKNSDAVDHCQVELNNCGQGGRCQQFPAGNRCQCSKGRMGLECRRPCQDIYKSCKRWKQEGQCSIRITPFFKDNCALSCKVCDSDGKSLLHALPIILEPLSWMVGRWETQTRNNIRFPTLMLSSLGYNEILDIQTAEVNAFDRATLNYSVTAISLDGRETHNELGFIALKPAKELNGFLEMKQKQLRDQVAIEMTSNTGVNVIEEGFLGGKAIKLKTMHKVSIDNHDKHFITATRIFLLRAKGVLEEQLVLVDGEGKQRRVTKRFRQIFDYLKAIDTQENE